jgi:hypothetical protein
MTDQVPILSTIDPASLTKAQRSILLYAECCLVDHGGLLEGKRMNDADLRALTDFQDAGLLRFGRLPFRAIAQMVARECTHWVVFSSAAWDLAHAARAGISQSSRRPTAPTAVVHARRCWRMVSIRLQTRWQREARQHPAFADVLSHT